MARATIVYFGPAAGGKTTNLQQLHAGARVEHRGDLVSVNSSQGRTLLFDLLPLGGFGLSGWEVKFRVLGVPGQAAYSAARRLALRGADAAVFVANSAADRWPDNHPSLREMLEGLALHAIDPRTIPLVLQYNKRDLPRVVSVEDMDRTLNLRKVPALPAVATRGDGVLETLAAIVEQVLEDVRLRYRNLALPPGMTAAQWTRESLIRVFGATKLVTGQAPPAAAAQPGGVEAWEAAAGHRVVRVALSEPASVPPTEAAAPDGEAANRLADSYAQASIALGNTVEDLREQRDEARRQLEDLQYALTVVESLAAGREADAALRDLLTRLAGAARCRRASLLVPTAAGGLQLVAGLTQDSDPLATRADGTQLISQHLLQPSLHVAGDANVPQGLAAALGTAKPPVSALASLPLRSGPGMHAVFLLYFGSTDPLPSERELAHLDALGRGLSASLLARRMLAQARAGRDTMTDAVIGEAAQRALRWLDLPALEDALEALRRGKVQGRSEPLDPILAALREFGAKIAGSPGLVVQGNAMLLRLALEGLTEITAEKQTPPVRIWARREGGHVALSVYGSRLVPVMAAGDRRALLAQRVARAHGGELTVETRPGVPAFTLRLPAPEPAGYGPASTRTAPGTTSGPSGPDSTA